MLNFILPVFIPGLPIDTTKVASFSDKLAILSELSSDNLLKSIIGGVIAFAWKLLIAVALFFIGKWVINRIYSFVRKIFIKREVERSLRTFLLSLIKIGLMLILIVIIIGVLGINTSSFVALFASAGIAVGMALSGTLQNFAGGVMILLFKPYKVGDFIEAQGQLGTVKEIQIFNTVLNTPDNKTIIIPNGGLSTGIINNYSKEGMRRVDWSFGIAYGDSFDKAKQLLEVLIAADNRILSEPSHLIVLGSLGDNAVNITVRAWVNMIDYWDVYFEMNEKVYKHFSEHDLNIPFPQMDVHLHQVDK